MRPQHEASASLGSRAGSGAHITLQPCLAAGRSGRQVSGSSLTSGPKLAGVTCTAPCRIEPRPRAWCPTLPPLSHIHTYSLCHRYMDFISLSHSLSLSLSLSPWRTAVLATLAGERPARLTAAAGDEALKRQKGVERKADPPPSSLYLSPSQASSYSARGEGGGGPPPPPPPSLRAASLARTTCAVRTGLFADEAPVPIHRS